MRSRHQVETHLLTPRGCGSCYFTSCLPFLYDAVAERAGDEADGHVDRGVVRSDRCEQRVDLDQVHGRQTA